MTLNKLSNKLLYDFLDYHYHENLQNAATLSMAVVNDIETPMQYFNGLNFKTREEFFTILKRIKPTNCGGTCDFKTYSIMILCLLDTLTCMVKNNHFYSDYCKANKELDSIYQRLLMVQSSLSLAGFTVEQIQVLIEIILRSAKRIEHHHELLYDNFIKIVQKFYQYKEYLLTCPMQYPNNNIPKNPISIQNTNLKVELIIANNKLTNKQPEKKQISIRSMFNICNNTDNVKTYEPSQDGHLKNVDKENILKEIKETTIKNTSNAFEVMMMSSKLLAKKIVKKN